MYLYVNYNTPPDSLLTCARSDVVGSDCSGGGFDLPDGDTPARPPHRHQKPPVGAKATPGHSTVPVEEPAPERRRRGVAAHCVVRARHGRRCDADDGVPVEPHLPVRRSDSEEAVVGVVRRSVPFGARWMCGGGVGLCRGRRWPDPLHVPSVPAGVAVPLDILQLGGEGHQDTVVGAVYVSRGGEESRSMERCLWNSARGVD